MLLLLGTVAGVMGVIQAFCFGFLAAVNYTFNVSYTFNASVGAVALILSIPSDSGDPRRDRSCLFRVQENQELPHFQGISQKPLRPLPHDVAVLVIVEDHAGLIFIAFLDGRVVEEDSEHVNLGIISYFPQYFSIFVVGQAVTTTAGSTESSTITRSRKSYHRSMKRSRIRQNQQKRAINGETSTTGAHRFLFAYQPTRLTINGDQQFAMRAAARTFFEDEPSTSTPVTKEGKATGC